MNTAIATENSVAQPEQYVAPSVDIRETTEGFELRAEMPGVPKDGIEVTVENGELILVGRRSDRLPPGDVLHRESHLRNFRRVFELDPAIDVARIAAKVEQGVLILSLPKADAVKPRRIAVEG